MKYMLWLRDVLSDRLGFYSVKEYIVNMRLNRNLHSDLKRTVNVFMLEKHKSLKTIQFHSNNSFNLFFYTNIFCGLSSSLLLHPLA